MMAAGATGRQRVLEIIFAVLAMMFIPGALIEHWFSTHAPKPQPPPAMVNYQGAFNAGLQLERDKQCEPAISEFREAQMYASKLNSEKYALIRDALDHVATCGSELGRDADVQGAYNQIIGSLIDEGNQLKRNGQLPDALAKFQEAERRLPQLTEPNDNFLKTIREELAEVYFKLKRYPEEEQVLTAMVESVRQPVNDYRSVLGERYMEIAYLRSHYDDWAGAEKSNLRAIEEFDNTIATYPGTDASGLALTSGAQFSKGMAMYWLEIAYARESKFDSGLTAAEDAFQYNQKLQHGSPEVAKQIAELAVDIARHAHREDLVDLWQQRLKKVPAGPCPVPNINNPACVTPASPAPRSN